MSSDFSTNANYISNSIKNSMYMNSYDSKKVLTQIKKIDTKLPLENHEDNPKKNIISKLYESEEMQKKIVKLLEDYEFKKPYRYCFLFHIVNLDSFKYLENNSTIECNFINPNNEFDFISTNLEKPTISYDTNEINIKFSKLIKNRNDDSTSYKSPIIVSIFKEEKLLQIKFDGVTPEFTEDDYYSNIILKTTKWIKNELELDIIELNSLNIADKILKAKNDNPLISHQDIFEALIKANDKSNGKISLRADDNNQLPIMARLNNLINDFKCEDDKITLKNFIENIEKGRRIYHRGLTFKRTLSNRGIFEQTVTFRNNFTSLDFILIHFYSNRQDKEKMDYVIKYIGNNR